MQVEICASTYQSAVNAQKGGAHRIELCEDLSVGGVTPKRDLIIQVVKDIAIPINILIRPRRGDFVYSEKEFEKMLLDIEYCRSLGCNGIVSGVLKSDKSIDIQRTRQLIESSKPMKFTFHRAFDQTSNAFEALEDLLQLGVNRVLTSGQAMTAIEGIQALKQLKNRANGKLDIVVGGSIRASNVLEFKKEGFKEVHSSALLNDNEHSDLHEIKKLVSLIKD